MSVGFAVALAVGIFAGIVFLVMVIALARHAKVLMRSVAEFQKAVQPVVEDIQREANEAAERAARLSEGIPGEPPGARIRR